jgi:hypothetical protein
MAVCPNHHTIIDNNPEQFSADVLRGMKESAESSAPPPPLDLTDEQTEFVIGATMNRLGNPSVTSVGQEGGQTAQQIVNMLQSERDVAGDSLAADSVRAFASVLAEVPVLVEQASSIRLASGADKNTLVVLLRDHYATWRHRFSEATNLHPSAEVRERASRLRSAIESMIAEHGALASLPLPGEMPSIIHDYARQVDVLRESREVVFTSMTELVQALHRDG